MSLIKRTVASIIFIFLSTSVLIPLVYWTIAFFVPAIDFQKVASRTILVVVIIFSFFLSRYFAIGRDRLGFGHFSRKVWNNMLLCAFSGAVIICILHVIQHLLGARVLEQQAHYSIFFSALVTALLVSVIEETIFRGLIYSILEKNFNTQLAVVLSAALYSIGHFFKAKDQYFDIVTWKSGFLAWYNIYQYVTDGHIMSSVLCLWALGICLALLRKISGHIFYCIGFHFGIVFAVKIATEYTKRIADYEYTWFVRGDIPIASYLTFLLLLFVIVILLVIIKLRDEPSSRQKPFVGIWLLFAFICGLWVSQLQNGMFLFNPLYYHRIEIHGKYRKKGKKIIISKGTPIRINGITMSSEPLATVVVRFHDRNYISQENAAQNFVEENRNTYQRFCQKYPRRNLAEFDANYTYRLEIDTTDIPTGTYELHIGATFHNNTNCDYFRDYYIHIK